MASEVKVIFDLLFQTLVRVLRQLSHNRSRILSASVLLLSGWTTEVVPGETILMMSAASTSWLLAVVGALET